MRIGEPIDTFGGAPGEEKARAFDVRGHAFLARKPQRRQGVVEAGPSPHNEDTVPTT